MNYDFHPPPVFRLPPYRAAFFWRLDRGRGGKVAILNQSFNQHSGLKITPRVVRHARKISLCGIFALFYAPDFVWALGGRPIRGSE